MITAVMSGSKETILSSDFN